MRKNRPVVMVGHFEQHCTEPEEEGVNNSLGVRRHARGLKNGVTTHGEYKVRRCKIFG